MVIKNAYMISQETHVGISLLNYLKKKLSNSMFITQIQKKTGS